MCRQVECGKCQKPTYAGCGMHIEQVLGHVPREQRCDCRDKAAAKEETSVTVAPSLFRRIFGA
jgi:hypothetical protein